MNLNPSATPMHPSRDWQVKDLVIGYENVAAVVAIPIIIRGMNSTSGSNSKT